MAWSTLAWTGGARAVEILEPPAADQRPSIADGNIVLLNGRRITPAGRFVRTQSYSWGLAISPDQSQAALLSGEALQIVSLDPLAIKGRIPPFGEKAPSPFREGTYMGCCYSPDGSKLYVGSCNRGKLVGLDAQTLAVVDEIALDGDGFADSFPGDFVLSADGKRAFVVDQHNYRIVVVDLENKQVTRTVRVGRCPLGIRLSDDETVAWVAHVGMFEYPLLPGVTADNRATAGLDFPAYGIPSDEAELGVIIDSLKVPGLGSPNHPDAMSVFKIDLQTGQVAARVKPGLLVGQIRDQIKTIGGASPCSVAVDADEVYVANATNDTISIVATATGQVLGHVELSVPGLERWRGVLPFGIDLDRSRNRLYVACAGLNAVAVVDVKARELLGYIPAGWFCCLVRVSRDHQSLFVASAKGVGSGPNGGKDFVPPARGLHPGDIMEGLFQVVPVPNDEQLHAYTRQVIANTYRKRQIDDDPRHPVPAAIGLRKSPIQHIVFIVKENRTYDQVFGDRPNGAGDATLAELGTNVTIKAGDKVVEHVNVAPNHQALADRFAMCDNFHCDSDQSNTGHRWVVGVYPNEWVEVNARSSIEERLFSSAPGRRFVNGASATVLPEDYNEAGALWEHLDRQQVSFFNFGFGTEMPASIEEQIHKHTGIKMSVSFPLPKPLFDRTSRLFATYNTSIPDQFRVDMFEQELKDRWLSGKEPFPRLITMVLPNDHLAGARPEAGYPFEESYMADNDLALGRVIHTLSRTPYWPKMLVIVTEDDSQGGRDHLEAHRSILMFIGPHAKKGHVSNTLCNFGSVLRLVFTLLDMPSLNQFDATASLPLDVFRVGEADPATYQVLPVDKRIFDPAKALKPFDRGFDWKSLLESPEMDDPEDMREGFRR